MKHRTSRRDDRAPPVPLASPRGASPAAVARIDAELGPGRRLGLSMALLLIELTGSNRQRAEVPVQAVRRVRSLVRATDHVLALEGSCLAVLLEDADLAVAAVVRERLRRALERTFAGSPFDAGLSVCIGRAATGRDGQHAGDLVRAALDDMRSQGSGAP